jgi:hypothetical protein
MVFLLVWVRTVGGRGLFTPPPKVVMLSEDPLGTLRRNLIAQRFYK